MRLENAYTAINTHLMETPDFVWASGVWTMSFLLNSGPIVLRLRDY
jgi:hypothetical protein